MKSDSIETFLKLYGVFDIRHDAQQYQVTTLLGKHDFAIDGDVTISMYQSSFNRLIDVIVALEQEKVKRSQNPAALAAYERYRQLIDLIPDDANT
jgi:hypothetical protein